MLPVGTSPLERLRRFWWPMLRTSILSAFVFTFIFSFTSFALVRWLAPEYWTIESLMAIEGGAAGISSYREDVSLLVLGGATLQGIVLLMALGMAGKWQQKQSYEIELVSEHYARKTIGKPNLWQRIGMSLHVPSRSHLFPNGPRLSPNPRSNIGLLSLEYGSMALCI